jgi:hypothetical protein
MTDPDVELSELTRADDRETGGRLGHAVLSPPSGRGASGGRHRLFPLGKGRGGGSREEDRELFWVDKRHLVDLQWRSYPGH